MARQQKQATTEVSNPVVPVKSLFERVRGFLEANDWAYTPNAEKSYFSMGFRIKEASVRVVLDVDETESWQRVLVFVCLPVFIPEPRRAAVAESILRINYGMIFGNLDMDCTDGEVRVRTVVEASGVLSDAMIERGFWSNLDTAGKYFAPLMAVAFGNAAPATAPDLVMQRQEGTLQ